MKTTAGSRHSPWIGSETRGPDCRARGPGQAGYSLIEICGVLLIMALLAAALIPSVIRQLDEAARTKEATDSSAIAAGLRSAILRNQFIPDHTTWASFVAEELAQAAGNVSTNQRGFARALLINPNLSLPRSGALGLPYTQGSAGISQPTNATVILLGSTRGALPLASGVPSAADFTALWNTPKGQKPTTATWNSYTSPGDDLQIQRINLETLFSRLILSNPTTNTPPSFNITTNSLITLTTNLTPWLRYYLAGTVFGLYDTNTSLVGREVLQEDTYRIFDGVSWRDSLREGTRASSEGSRTLTEVFMNSPAPTPTPKWYGTPAGQATLYQAFMVSYTSWANQNPCFSYGGAGNSGFAAEMTMLTSVLGTQAKAGILVE